jgi:hypothetical protein
MGYVSGVPGGHALHWAANWWYGSAELAQAAAFRVYCGAAELQTISG